MDNPYVLVAGDKIEKVNQISPILDLVKPTGRDLLIFCPDLQQEPLSSIIYNKNKNLLTACAVNIPWQAGEEGEMLKDVAAITGATFINNKSMKSLKNVNLSELGSCARAKISALDTELIGARGKKERIEKRVQDIFLEIDRTKDVSLTKKNSLIVFPI